MKSWYHIRQIDMIMSRIFLFLPNSTISSFGAYHCPLFTSLFVLVFLEWLSFQPLLTCLQILTNMSSESLVSPDIATHIYCFRFDIWFDVHHILTFSYDLPIFLFLKRSLKPQQIVQGGQTFFAIWLIVCQLGEGLGENGKYQKRG